MDDEQVLAERFRRSIDTISYMTLATADADGNPWVSPVYFTPVEHRAFYWVSSPEAVHSRNIAARPEVRIVFYDSTVPVGQAAASYVGATAGLVPDDEVEAAARVYSARLPGGRSFGVDELTGDADLRLYVAHATTCDVLVRGGDPDFGTGIDGRRPVDPSLPAG
jgi:nitroimidazol reductase NimA-like FMN-containing flavoprotein (pyridoxamine 5'-phosphate oxidase superfamily)